MAKLNLPQSIAEVDGRSWDSFAPFYDELLERSLDPEAIPAWLADWSNVSELAQESRSWLQIQLSLDTTDEEKEKAVLECIEQMAPAYRRAEQKMREKLLATGWSSPEMAIPIREMHSETELFRDENVPLFAELEALGNQYDKITGGVNVEWNRESINLSKLQSFLEDSDRATREKAYRLWAGCWLENRAALNDLYAEMIGLRSQLARNAGKTNFREYAFQAMGRFDYAPEDCLGFHNAIEEAVVPAATRILNRKKELAGHQLRPWDWIPEIGTIFDPQGLATLTPYQDQDDLIARSIEIFHKLDPQLSSYFAKMADDAMLDLDTRPGKALGGYCAYLPVRHSPFIFMNGVGRHTDVQTLLHEAGHAFHAFDAGNLPFTWQHNVPIEFCEVASMGMEMLSAPYIDKAFGGFYSPPEAAQARIQHLESVILFLPYMAVVDAFQHWVYLNPARAADANMCDAQWETLCQRFLPGINWEGFEEMRKCGWHRKLHIFRIPFYYVEYGIAQLGALQIWRNSLKDHASALTAYRKGLSLGNTVTLPELFEAVGVEFRMDAGILTELVALIEETLDDLRGALA